MRVELGEDTVSKIFKNSGNNDIRYRREKKSLQRLSGSCYFPRLIAFDNSTKSLKMSRLPGSQPDRLSKCQVNLLRKMVARLHSAGVARHAIPIRDLLCSYDDDLYMVDFERVTLRYFKFSPVWLIAKCVSNYHLYRLVQAHQPELLSETEKQWFLRLHKIRKFLQKIKPIKSRVKSLTH